MEFVAGVVIGFFIMWGYNRWHAGKPIVHDPKEIVRDIKETVSRD